MSRHDELWQLYSDNGQPLEGQGLASESPHNADASFGLAIVWLWRLVDGTAEVALQKRAMTKKRWPGMYSTSAGGHINVGETPVLAALRETREEISIQLEEGKLHFIGAFRVAHEPQNIRFVFDYQVQGGVDFRFDDGEVDAMKWLSLDELEAQLADPDSDMVMARYGRAYSMLTLEHLRRRAEHALGERNAG